MKCPCGAHRHREKIQKIGKKNYLISICVRCAKEISIDEVEQSKVTNEWVIQ